MEWFTEEGVQLGFVWLCADDVRLLTGLEPDMGDQVSWKPGTCEKCGKEITVFTPSE